MGVAGLRRLICAVRGHDPESAAIWNRGYAFAHCRRCCAPIVRAVFGGWRTPPAGYRIVWPGERAVHVRAPAGPRAISEADFMSDGAATAPPRQQFAPFAGDFMAEDSETSPLEPPRRQAR